MTGYIQAIIGVMATNHYHQKFNVIPNTLIGIGKMNFGKNGKFITDGMMPGYGFAQPWHPYDTQFSMLFIPTLDEILVYSEFPQWYQENLTFMINSIIILITCVYGRPIFILCLHHQWNNSSVCKLWNRWYLFSYQTSPLLYWQWSRLPVEEPLHTSTVSYVLM